MKRSCPSCKSLNKKYISFGHFVRKSDGRKLKRFLCKNCGKTFSMATFQSCYRQRKRRLNPRIYEGLCSLVSQRRIARTLNINLKTVARKLCFLAKEAKIKNQKDFAKLPVINSFQFDDLETFEHTKLRPLSVIMAVEYETRRILGFRVSSMPAKGLIARKSREKYGKRIDERAINRKELFYEISGKIEKFSIISSDESSHYTKDVKSFFPFAIHKKYKGRKSSASGQGELKKGKFDPLFSVNHTFAMLRGNINRLIRKTWCTTKLAQSLNDHIELYVNYHNQHL